MAWAARRGRSSLMAQRGQFSVSPLFPCVRGFLVFVQGRGGNSPLGNSPSGSSRWGKLGTHGERVSGGAAKSAPGGSAPLATPRHRGPGTEPGTLD